MSDCCAEAVLIVPEQVVKANFIEPLVEQASVKMSSAQFADQLVHFSAEYLVQSRKCPAAPKDARVRRRNSSFPTYTRHSRPAVTRSKLVSKFGQSAHDRQSRL
jgi:hypothetical protein